MAWEVIEVSQQERSDDVDGDEEPTLIASASSFSAEARRRAEASSGPVLRTASSSGPVSSFGVQQQRPRDPDADTQPDRPSLYERLVRSGALDEVMAVAARDQADLEEPTEPVELPSGFAAAARVSGEQRVLEDLIEEAPEGLELVELTEEQKPPPKVSAPPPLPRNTPMPDLPSVMLGPGASLRYDSTERVVLEEITERVLTQSLTPLSSVPSRPPPGPSRSYGAVLIVGALVAAAGSVAWWAFRLPAEPEVADPRSAQVTEVVTSVEAPQPAPEVISATAEEHAEVAVVQAPPTALAVEAPPAVADQPAAAVAAPPGKADVSPAEPAAVRSAAPQKNEALALTQRAPRAASTAPAGAGSAENTPAAESAVDAPETVTAPAPDAGKPERPAQPTREQVVAVMNGLVPALRECVGDSHGTVRLKLTVRGEGNVSYALVTGDYAGTAEGSCIAQAVKAASFPAFSQPSMQISYPLVL